MKFALLENFQFIRQGLYSTIGSQAIVSPLALLAVTF